MNTKLTLRMDDVLVHQAKTQAAQRGKSVSQMFSEFVLSLGLGRRAAPSLPPVTGSLLGIMKSHPLSEDDYQQHLQEKHS
ncbi:MAG: antitoxin [Verrucomicrobia bacterium]|nr:antitoxin [Verrucomicrobiota bacterium]MBT7701755.1 antitoxin [Verrucomicrobiota bacterium]